jgi:DNA-binding phage protein
MFAAMAQFERARAKADDAVQKFRDGMRVAHIAKDPGIGRGSVYRALEAAGLTGEI